MAEGKTMSKKLEDKIAFLEDRIIALEIMVASLTPPRTVPAHEWHMRMEPSHSVNAYKWDNKSQSNGV